MREAVIVEAVRTPVGKRNGGLSGMHAADLSGLVLNALAERTGLDPVTVDDVMWGCVSLVGDRSSQTGVAGSTSEIQRNIIAQQVLGLPRWK